MAAPPIDKGVAGDSTLIALKVNGFRSFCISSWPKFEVYSTGVTLAGRQTADPGAKFSLAGLMLLLAGLPLALSGGGGT